ncbi:ubiquitin specific peptidase y chromosome [Grosmannia clavigera kw1407]|uniref:ubiquitinyl hydrolase 1 n=1 Tax=Grosmannia clavigera (strain kw1407 / UAMH 11150) TaxID=655863 RepID=F0XJM4_GROCL|nr:ubiquitin specific peptidase y chromosome [Grosmannia clavigera kw1407]EFX02307.1 ubiquitin specific peptidase y chromosome [Grosmannia clavigera kw1407]
MGNPAPQQATAAAAGSSAAAATAAGQPAITGTGALPFENLPSAGMLFQPILRPVPQFLSEVRADLDQPVHLDITPRGLDNPMMLCYRNSVLVALLNTNRILTFLHTHMRQARRFYSHHQVSGHLLTRLYHLAVAYWDRNGQHPMSPSDNYERLVTLFWRACKADSVMVDNSGVQHVVECWLTLCNQQPGQNGAVELFRRQQDAIDLFKWIWDTVIYQLSWHPEQYGNGQALHNFSSMFAVCLTTRYVCHLCNNRVRLRRQETETSLSIPISIPGRPPRPGARTQRLVDLLERELNVELADGKRCDRCQQTAKPGMALKRLQATPEVLTIQLMRLHWNPQANTTTKMHDVVDFPQFLDVSRWLEPHVYGSQSRVLYRLAAVISHSGNGQGGHYVTFVRRQEAIRTFAQLSDPTVVWTAKQADEQLQRTINDTMRQEGVLRPGSDQVIGQSTGPFDDHWPVPDKKRVCELEALDSGWLRISDTQVADNVPFRKVNNTSRDVDHQVGSADWFDPILLLYEKMVEEFHDDPIVGERVFQQPMNAGAGHDNDVPPTDQGVPAVVVGEPAWVFADNCNPDGGDGNGGDGGDGGDGGSAMQGIVGGDKAKPAVLATPEPAKKSFKNSPKKGLKKSPKSTPKNSPQKISKRKQPTGKSAELAKKRRDSRLKQL